MMFSHLTLTSFLLSLVAGNHYSKMFVSATEECTNGLLYVTDATSSVIRAFDVSGETLQDLTVAETIDTGMNQQFVMNTGHGSHFASVYRGAASNGYIDGQVRFIHTGVSAESHGDHVHVEKAPATLLTNGDVFCSRPIHFVPNHNKVAVFCDGSFGTSLEDQVNSTIWVVNEDLLSSSSIQTAVVFTRELVGSHHGVAIPFSDDHVLHSLPTDGRINRVAGASSLPNTFTIVDFEDNPVHNIANETDPNSHCTGYHGSGFSGNTFVMGCSADHGGLLVGQYNKADNTSPYVTEAVMYPDSFQGYRTGTFADHPSSGFIVANFAGPGTYHLIAFKPSDMQTNTFTDSHLQAINDSVCSFDFEKSEGGLVLTWLLSGKLAVYEIETGWNLVAEIPVFNSAMSQCSDAFMVPGYGQVFIVEPGTKLIHAVELSHVDHDHEVSIKTTTLDFEPFSAVVSGVPEGAACHLEDDHEHSSSASAIVSPMKLSVISFTIVIVLLMLL